MLLDLTPHERRSAKLEIDKILTSIGILKADKYDLYADELSNALLHE